jgi:multicomponent Na+:H+ antiporter subunit E
LLSWPVRFLGFCLHFVRELVTSNIVVGWDIVRPHPRLAPGIVRLPLRSRTDLEITMFANLISLTPGTLTLAVQNDPPVLYVHGMYAPDRDEFLAELYDLEGRMLTAMRLSGAAGEVPADTGRSTGGAG